MASIAERLRMAQSVRKVAVDDIVRKHRSRPRTEQDVQDAARKRLLEGSHKHLEELPADPHAAAAAGVTVLGSPGAPHVTVDDLPPTAILVPPLLLPARPDEAPAGSPTSGGGGGGGDEHRQLLVTGGDSASVGSPHATSGYAHFGPFMVRVEPEEEEIALPVEYQEAVEAAEAEQWGPVRRRPSRGESEGPRSIKWGSMTAIEESGDGYYSDPELPSTPLSTGRRRRLTPSMRALDEEMTPEVRRMRPLQRLRHFTSGAPRNDGLRIGGRVRHVKQPPPTTPHFRRDAARVHAKRDPGGERPFTQVLQPKNPILATSQAHQQTLPAPRQRLGARRRLGVPSGDVADVLVEGTRARALPKAWRNEFAVNSPEALGIPKYDTKGNRVKKTPVQADAPVNTGEDTTLDLEGLRERYKVWREPDAELGEQRLDDEFDAIEARQKEQYEKGKEFRGKQSKWKTRMRMVNVFRNLAHEGQRVGESGEGFVVEEQPEYVGFQWDDHPGRKWSPPASVSSDDSGDQTAALLPGGDGEALETPGGGPEASTGRRSSRSSGSRNSRNSIGASSTGSLPSERTAEQIEASANKWAILYGDMEGIEAAKEEEEQGGEVAPEDGDDTAGAGVGLGKEEEGEPPARPVDEFPTIDAFGPNPAKRLGLQEDIFAAFRKEDTTVCDDFWGNLKKFIVTKRIWYAKFQLSPRADALRTRLQIPNHVVRRIRSQFYSITIDVRGMSRATLGLFCAMMYNDKAVGFAPYKVVFRGMGLVATPFFSYIFDQILEPLAVNAKTVAAVMEQTDAGDRDEWDVGETGGWEKRRRRRRVPGQSGTRTGINIMQRKLPGLAKGVEGDELFQLEATNDALPGQPVREEGPPKTPTAATSPTGSMAVGSPKATTRSGATTARTAVTSPEATARLGPTTARTAVTSPKATARSGPTTARTAGTATARSGATTARTTSGPVTGRTGATTARSVGSKFGERKGSPAPSARSQRTLHGAANGEAKLPSVEVGSSLTAEQRLERQMKRFEHAPEAKRRRVLSLSEFFIVIVSLANMTKEEMLRMVFQSYDLDGSGTLDQDEFLKLWQALNVEGTLFDNPLAKMKAISEFDMNSDGVLDFDEFYAIHEKYPIMFASVFKLHYECKQVLGEEEAKLMAHRRDFIKEYRRTHAGLAPPEGSWARAFPHLAKAGPGPCLSLRQNLLALIKPLIRGAPPPRQRAIAVPEGPAGQVAVPTIDTGVEEVKEEDPDAVADRMRLAEALHAAEEASAAQGSEVPEEVSVHRSELSAERRAERHAVKKHALQVSAARLGIRAWTSPKARPLQVAPEADVAVEERPNMPTSGNLARTSVEVSEEDKKRGIVGFTADGRAIISLNAADPSSKLQRKAPPNVKNKDRLRIQGRYRIGSQRKRFVAVSPENGKKEAPK